MAFQVTQMAAVALGGALGCVARWGVEQIDIFDSGKFYFTITVNIVGCLLMGILRAVFAHYDVERIWCTLVFTGILGGFTTYSALIYDTMRLSWAGSARMVALYLAITLVGGLLAGFGGYHGTDRLLKILS